MDYISLHGETNVNAQYVSATTAVIDNLDIDNIETNNIIVYGTMNISSLTANQLLKLDNSKNVVNDTTDYIDQSELTTILTNYVTNSSLTSTLLNYVTNSSLTSTLANYVTNSNLTSTLANYVTNSSLTTTLLDYVTSTYLSTVLLDYVSSASLSITLSDYVTNSSLSSTLADYITSSTLTTVLSDYVTNTSLSTTLTDYFLLNSNNTTTGNLLINGTNGTSKFQITRSDGTNIMRVSTSAYETYLGCSLVPDLNSTYLIGSPTYKMAGVYSTNVYVSSTLNVSNITGSRIIQTDGSSNLIGSNTLPSSCAATNMTLTTPTMSGTTTTQAIVPVANNASAIGTAAKGYQGIYLSWVSYLGGADWIQGGASSPDIGTGWGFAVSNTYRAYITSSGLQLTGSSAIKSSGTSWTNPSDERLKQNITDFNKGLDVIDQIRCREFEYRNNPGKKIVGVIAQEMLDVYPECISTGANDMYNFDASDITFLLINSVKELKKQNKLLLSRIEELEKNAFVIL